MQLNGLGKINLPLRVILNKSAEKGPPNLDELFIKFLKKITNKQRTNIFSAKKTSPNPSGNEIFNYPGIIIIGFMLFATLLLWFLSGIFIVSPAEHAIVLRFGQYHRELGAGMHWMPRFVDNATIVNVQHIGTFSYKSEMLTKDENIVYVSLSVQYRINDPRAFLYNTVNPIVSLQQATASALRQVIGHTILDDILTTGRTLVREEVSEQLKAILAPYYTGLEVMDVTLQPAQPPEQVTAAFDDAINAREDEQRYINQAQTYAEKVIPIAQGQAARVYQAALAEKEKMILHARGAIAGYLALLPSYEKAPEVTRKRLYLESMESILNKTSKILIDAKGNNNVIYLPIDKWISTPTVNSEKKLDNTKAIPIDSPISTENALPPALHPSPATSHQNAFSDRESYSELGAAKYSPNLTEGNQSDAN